MVRCFLFGTSRFAPPSQLMIDSAGNELNNLGGCKSRKPLNEQTNKTTTTKNNNTSLHRRDVPVGVPLDLSTPTGMDETLKPRSRLRMTLAVGET